MPKTWLKELQDCEIKSQKPDLATHIPKESLISLFI
jgi:hypothetical protein